MKETSAHALLPIAIMATFFLSSCGASRPLETKPPPPPVDEDIADLAPAGHDTFARIDLGKLHASPLWKVTDVFADSEDLRIAREAAGFDLLARIDEVLVVGSEGNSSQPPDFLIIMKGRFDANLLISSMVNSGKGTSGGLGGYSGALRDNIALIAVTERTAILGTEPAVMASLGLAGGEGESIKHDPRVGRISLHKEEVAIFRYRLGDSPPRLGSLRRTPIGNWRWMDKVAKLDASLEIGTGLNLRASMDMGTESLAQRARRDIVRTSRQLSGNAFVMLLGIARFLRPIEVSGEGTAVEVAYVLTPEDMTELVKLAERFKQMKDLLGGDDRGEKGPVELDPPMLKRRVPAPPEGSI